MSSVALHVPDRPEWTVDDLAELPPDRNEPRPDVVVIRVEHANRTPAPVEGAPLAVEVLSPSSTLRDTFEKSRVYARAGIESYWILRPLPGRIELTEFQLAGRDYEAVAHTSDVFTTDRPWPVTLDLPALAERWGEMLAAAKPAD